jgi:putative FmdB family regulatory protein
MPLYDVRCADCAAVVELQLPMAAEVPACGACGGRRERLISLPRVARVQGPTGAITDMRQVYDTCGRDWRAAGTRRTEGGAGAVAYYHRAAR